MPNTGQKIKKHLLAEATNRDQKKLDLGNW